jgi:hypothetical protein
LGHGPGVDPFVAPAPERGRRYRRIGDAVVGAAKDEDLDEMVDDDPVGHPGPMAAKRMIVRVVRPQGRDLVPDGGDDACFDRGHGNAPRTESLTTCSSVRTSPAPPSGQDRFPYWRTLLVFRSDEKPRRRRSR